MGIDDLIENWPHIRGLYLRTAADIDLRFRSGNSVPVARAHITDDEWKVFDQYEDASEALSIQQAQTITRLTDELDRLRKDAAWQPLETVPMDGTLFVARIQWSDEPVVGYFDGNRFYVTNEHHEVSCGTYCYGGSIGTASGTNPTHWMPLSPPPAIDAAIAAQEAE